MGGGEKASPSFDHQYEQNPEMGSRVTCSQSFMFMGFDRWKPKATQAYHYEEVAQRTPVSLSKRDVFVKKSEYGLGWARAFEHPEKDTINAGLAVL